MYQIEGERVLFDWLAQQPDVAKRERMLEFMSDLADRPTEVGIRVPDISKPIYVAPTPVDNWVVRYLVVEQFRVIKLGSFAHAP